MLILVRYCQNHAWLADLEDHTILGRGDFATMKCSACGHLSSMVVFAVKSRASANCSKVARDPAQDRSSDCPAEGSSSVT